MPPEDVLWTRNSARRKFPLAPPAGRRARPLPHRMLELLNLAKQRRLMPPVTRHAGILVQNT